MDYLQETLTWLMELLIGKYGQTIFQRWLRRGEGLDYTLLSDSKEQETSSKVFNQQLEETPKIIKPRTKAWSKGVQG